MLLVAGDAMLDRYIRGDVRRLSPDAPVPIVSNYTIEERAGGAANVLANVIAMGGVAGSIYGSGPPIIKTRVLGAKQHIVRLDDDPQQVPIDPAEFLGALQGRRYVVFVDYWKGSLDYIAGLIQIAKRVNCQVIIDPKGHDWTRYAGADVIKPNLNEMRDVVGGWSNEEQLHRKATALLDQFSIGAIMLTRAAEGMTLFRRSGAFSVMAEPTDVVCVSGAGEAALAALAVALSKGHFLDAALKYANKAASIAVSRFGTTVVKAEEVFR